MAAERTKALTVRLPEHLYQAGAEAAKRRKVSLSKLVRESLEAAVRAEEDQELYQAFERVGKYDDNDVEYAVPAILEVLEGDES